MARKRPKGPETNIPLPASKKIGELTATSDAEVDFGGETPPPDTMDTPAKPSPLPEPVECSTCRHFKRLSETEGECRRYPPVVIIPSPVLTYNGPRGIFPITLAAFYCGEYAGQV